MSSESEVNHLRFWLKNLQQNPQLTPQQFAAMEKAINLAIAIFENTSAPAVDDMKKEEPMEIDNC